MTSTELNNIRSSWNYNPPLSKRQIARKLKKNFIGNVCPVCGSERIRFYDHRVEYPERWAEYYCENCGFIVEGSDNSEWINWQERHNLQGTRSMNKIWKEIQNTIL